MRREKSQDVQVDKKLIRLAVLETTYNISYQAQLIKRSVQSREDKRVTDT